MQWYERHREDNPRTGKRGFTIICESDPLSFYFVCCQSWNRLEPIEERRNPELPQLSRLVRYINEWVREESSLSLLKMFCAFSRT